MHLLALPHTHLAQQLDNRDAKTNPHSQDPNTLIPLPSSSAGALSPDGQGRRFRALVNETCFLIAKFAGWSTPAALFTHTFLCLLVDFLDHSPHWRNSTVCPEWHAVFALQGVVKSFAFFRPCLLLSPHETHSSSHSSREGEMSSYATTRIQNVQQLEHIDSASHDQSTSASRSQPGTSASRSHPGTSAPRNDPSSTSASRAHPPSTSASRNHPSTSAPRDNPSSTSASRNIPGTSGSRHNSSTSEFRSHPPSTCARRSHRQVSFESPMDTCQNDNSTEASSPLTAQLSHDTDPNSDETDTATDTVSTEDDDDALSFVSAYEIPDDHHHALANMSDEHDDSENEGTMPTTSTTEKSHDTKTDRTDSQSVRSRASATQAERHGLKFWDMLGACHAWTSGVQTPLDKDKGNDVKVTCQKVTCDDVTCDKVNDVTSACQKVTCGKVTCGKVTCDKSTCHKVTCDKVKTCDKVIGCVLGPIDGETREQDAGPLMRRFGVTLHDSFGVNWDEKGRPLAQALVSKMLKLSRSCVHVWLDDHSIDHSSHARAEIMSTVHFKDKQERSFAEDALACLSTWEAAKVVLELCNERVQRSVAHTDIAIQRLAVHTDIAPSRANEISTSSLSTDKCDDEHEDARALCVKTRELISGPTPLATDDAVRCLAQSLEAHVRHSSRASFPMGGRLAMRLTRHHSRSLVDEIQKLISGSSHVSPQVEGERQVGQSGRSSPRVAKAKRQSSVPDTPPSSASVYDTVLHVSTDPCPRTTPTSKEVGSPRIGRRRSISERLRAVVKRPSKVG
jgi:hypothetical protein